MCLPHPQHTTPVNQRKAPGDEPGASSYHAARTATLLADTKGDYVAAAKFLDAALAQDESAPAAHGVQALVFRAGLAITMGDQQLARGLLADVQQIPLQDDDRATLSDELQRATDLEHMLQ